LKDLTREISDYLLRPKNVLNELNVVSINVFINVLLEARDSEKQIFIMGNGGSAATASH
jgi:D-sedoheptulose 7-phosphate isomerase